LGESKRRVAKRVNIGQGGKRNRNRSWESVIVLCGRGLKKGSGTGLVGKFASKRPKGKFIEVVAG